MRTNEQIDEGKTIVYRLFEGMLVDTRFNDHLEHYVESFSAKKDEEFVNLAGEIFKNIMMDIIKMKRMLPIMKAFQKEVEEFAKTVREM